MNLTDRPSTWPIATYRVQLHSGFTFDDAADLAPYLASLGVSHLYCSPILQAVSGSTHGYDVVDHGQLSEDLGGAAAFARMADALDEHGLGIVIDIVPNHMALAPSSNRWWWDVLEDGPTSRFARYFDIDWGASGQTADPSVLVPILHDHLGRILEGGELGLARRGGTLVVIYRDHELPLSPRSFDEVLSAAARRVGSPELARIAEDLGALPHAADDRGEAIEARHRGKFELRQRLAALVQLAPELAYAIDGELALVVADAGRFELLLARQNYRLAHWRTADEELDYRRFFSIATLAGLRVEDEDVFADSHRLIGELVTSGRVTGLRIDHIDGLRDPSAYLRRLRALVPDAYVVVEKILARGERLPSVWEVSGTSGYDHLNAVNDLFVDETGEVPMTAAYCAFVEDDASFDEIARDARRHVVSGELVAETERLTGLLAAACASRRRHGDHTRRDLRGALSEVLVAFPVYRTYVAAGADPTEEDRARVAAAVTTASAANPDIDVELLELLGSILVGDEVGLVETELAVRFQQLSAPVMAKGVEDTAFYRYQRLVSLNEVGGDPSSFGRPVSDFHDHCVHAATHWPDTMVTLSTHDTKRSADVRARIDLLSEIPRDWAATCYRWAGHNERYRREGAPDRATEALLYQTLVGTWPIEVERLQAAMGKAAKEAKVHTSWTTPHPRYDGALADFIGAVHGDPWFVREIEAFLDQHRLVLLGRMTTLSQVTLLATATGVPDLYQGTELWDNSLVDPDNRRPLDHVTRAGALVSLLPATAREALHHLDDGGTKLWLISRLLRDRRRRPSRYAGRQHIAMPASGPKAHHVVAFHRQPLAVIVPRLLVGLAEDWKDTTITLPGGSWQDVLTGALTTGGTHRVAEVLADFPVAVLASDAVAPG